MKKGLSLGICLVGIVFITSFIVEPTKSYKVEVYQNGQLIVPINNEVFLDKNEFYLQVTLQNLKGLHVYSSFNKKMFEMKSSEDFVGIDYIGGFVIVDSKHNLDKALNVANGHKNIGIGYWFYDKNVEYHLFDNDVIVDNEKVIGKRTIQNIYNLDSNKSIPIAQIDKPVHLIFFNVEHKKEDHKKLKSVNRYKLKINWKK